MSPSIITTMINNFLELLGKFGEQNEVVFFNSQNTWSSILIVCAVICMPLMLCVKPIAYATCLKADDQKVIEFDEIEAEDADREHLVNKSESKNSSIVGKDNVQ